MTIVIERVRERERESKKKKEREREFSFAEYFRVEAEANFGLEIDGILLFLKMRLYVRMYCT